MSVANVRLVVMAVVLAAGWVAAEESSRAAASAMRSGSVVYEDGKAKFIADREMDNAAAYGSFDPSANHKSGFGILRINTGSSRDSEQEKFFAAGMLEGALTAPELYDQYVNLRSSFGAPLNGSVPENVTRYLDDQSDWIAQTAAERGREDPFWNMAGLIFAQFQGLQAGYNVVAVEELPLFAFRLLNWCGDLFDIVPAVCPNLRKDFTRMTTEEMHRFTTESGHCSALIKLTPDYSDLFFGHSSWFRFQVMNRIFKSYNLVSEVAAAQHVSFSSYPGFLESLDDFYVAKESSLAMVQTTNNVFNTSLYVHVHPQTLPAWMRVRIAMALSKTGEEWGTNMARDASGTYTNQYMVVDLDQFTPGKPLEDGALWVVEEIPGYVAYSDQTQTLAFGAWPSYNVPFHKDIYDMSGYPAIVAQHGPRYSYDLAPRAQIFRRDAASVKDLESYQAILRYNNFKVDPISQGDPMAAICSRGDLGTGSKFPGGCYDTKATSYSLLKNSNAVTIINGPTTSHNLPPFTWAEFPTASHVGLPHVFNNTFESVQAFY